MGLLAPGHVLPEGCSAYPRGGDGGRGTCTAAIVAQGAKGRGGPRLTQKRGSPPGMMLLQRAQHLPTHTSRRVSDQEPANARGLSNSASASSFLLHRKCSPHPLRTSSGRPTADWTLSLAAGPQKAYPLAILLPAGVRETPGAPTAAACREEEEECVRSAGSATAGPGSHATFHPGQERPHSAVLPLPVV